MKKLAFAVVMASVAVVATADVYSNGNFVSDTLGDRSVSRINADPMGGTFGWNVNAGAFSPGPNFLLDDYTVGASNILVTKLTVFAYARASTNLVNFATGRVMTFSGDNTPAPGNAQLIYGDHDNNRMMSSAFAADGNNNPIYRVSNEGALDNTDRRIQRIEIGLGGGVELQAGSRVWFEWGLKWAHNPSGTNHGGIGILHSSTRGNGYQFQRGSNVYNAIAHVPGDMATANDLAYEIEYTAVPEPGTMLAVGAGLVALAARRRRKA